MGSKNSQGDLFRRGIPDRAKVAKKNAMIHMRHDWGRLKQRVVALLISQIQKDDENFMTQRISVSDLEEMYERGGGGLYERLAMIADELLDEKIVIPTSTTDGYEKWNLMSGCRYEPGAGYIEAHFNKDMEPFLLQLSDHFTQYELDEFVALESKYAMRIYELLKSFERMSDRKRFEVGELRRMFCCENKYKRPRNFRRRVIDRAKEEINKKTRISFDYEEHREANSPVAYTFIVTNRSQPTRLRPPAKRRPSKSEITVSSPDPDKYEVWLDGLSEERRNEFRTAATDAVIEEDGISRSQLENSPLNWRVERKMRQMWDSWKQTDTETK